VDARLNVSEQLRYFKAKTAILYQAALRAKLPNFKVKRMVLSRRRYEEKKS